jgi:hypothetical protein
MRPLVMSLCLLAPLAPAGAPPDIGPDMDPIALDVLRAVCDPIRRADDFSMRLLVGKERIGSNGQIITEFNFQHISVDRPGKIRVEFQSAHHDLVLFNDEGKAFLFAPKENLYANVDAASTIEQTLDILDKRDITLPIAPFLRHDPYAALVDGVKTAAVIGSAEIADKSYTHLAFTEADADWQLWVENGDHPLPKRMQIVYKTLPDQPRITVEFQEWDLTEHFAPDTFTFRKPDDAKQIEFKQIKPAVGVGGGEQ